MNLPFFKFLLSERECLPRSVYIPFKLIVCTIIQYIGDRCSPCQKCYIRGNLRWHDDTLRLKVSLQSHNQLLKKQIPRVGNISIFIHQRCIARKVWEDGLLLKSLSRHFRVFTTPSAATKRPRPQKRN